LTYDGYGRLKEQQTPAQTAPTQYLYNSDDTVLNVLDARGVVTTFAYNNRHLVTGISYGSPAGITQTAPVSLSYDAAGNRTSLTDGSGNKSYQYDQLSRLISETKQFTGLSGSYTLSYGYNLGGELTSVTDPTGASISYGYDQTGRMTGVTGSSFAGVTSYATNMQYRAWGAVKSASFGDNSSLSASYNSRLLPTDFSISNSISKHYEYNADGRLRYSRNNGSGMFDRSYTYDHLGRVIEAASGPLARGEADTDQRPYNLSYEYDELSHLKQSVGRVWETPHETNAGTGVYVNDKNTSWQYDVDGRLTNSGETQYSFDAAGRVTTVVGYEGDLQQTQVFDGLGVRTKLSSQQATHNQNGTTITETKTQFFVTSSVLNQVVTELDQSGAKTRTFVYQGSQVLAWQQQTGSTQTLAWEHRDLSNASVNISGLAEGSNAAELEPMGMNAGAFHLIAPPPPQHPPLVEARTYPGFADMVLGSQCRVDGIDMPCSMASGEATALCPPSGCRSLNLKTNRVEYYHAYADGNEGYLAVNAEYTGNGEVWTPDDSSVLINQTLAGTQDSSVTVGSGVRSFLAHTSGGGLSQNSYPFLGNNPFPQITGSNLKEANAALEMAKDVAKKGSDCDHALKDAGIPSLTALIEQMTINGNVFDGRSSTIGLPPPKMGPRPTVESHLQENRDKIGAEVIGSFLTGRHGNTTFLNHYFFDPSFPGFSTQQRALILLHEVVHQFGNKSDLDFGSSSRLTDRIAEKCFPGLKAAKLLGKLSL
jgi:YD repeat-containing protein